MLTPHFPHFPSVQNVYTNLRTVYPMFIAPLGSPIAGAHHPRLAGAAAERRQGPLRTALINLELVSIRRRRISLALDYSCYRLSPKLVC